MISFIIVRSPILSFKIFVFFSTVISLQNPQAISTIPKGLHIFFLKSFYPGALTKKEFSPLNQFFLLISLDLEFLPEIHSSSKLTYYFQINHR